MGTRTSTTGTSDNDFAWPDDPRAVVTALASTCTDQDDQTRALTRHCNCEWGDIDCKRRAYNDAVIQQRHGSLVSLHTSTSGEHFVIVSNSRMEFFVIASPYELDFFETPEILAVLQRCPVLREIEIPL